MKKTIIMEIGAYSPFLFFSSPPHMLPLYPLSFRAYYFLTSHFNCVVDKPSPLCTLTYGNYREFKAFL
jgi:hypothetical protein